MHFCTWADEDQPHQRGIAPNGLSEASNTEWSSEPQQPHSGCCFSRCSSYNFATSHLAPFPIAYLPFAFSHHHHPSFMPGPPLYSRGKCLLCATSPSPCALWVANPRPGMPRSVVNVRIGLFYLCRAHTRVCPDAPLPTGYL